MSKNELITLLREVRKWLPRHEKEEAQLHARIDAALSASKADEVHWLKPASRDGREFVDDGKHDRETWVKNCITHWEWGHEVYGAANSEREAKAAAFEASKGMR